MMKKPLIFPFVLLFCLFLSPPSAQADRNVVRLQTSFGDITVELFPDDAPITVANFLRYVRRGFYDGLIFHRVIDEFMIQGGAYDADLYTFLENDPNLDDPNWTTDPLYYHEPNEPIVNESDNGLKNLRGTIAMARTNDPDSATSQFFINQVDNPFLDAGAGSDGYAVFGRVIAGLSIVDDIAQAPTHFANSTFEDLPDNPITIITAEEILAFDANSIDFSEAPFLRAGDGAVRTFAGQSAQVGNNFTHTFTRVSFLGVDCLQWEQAADEDSGVDDFVMLLAKDKAGGMWIYKYIINEGEDDQEIVIEAENLIDGVSFSEFASENMHFRLILGQFNPDNLDDPNNTITLGSGDTAQTWKIVSTEATLDGFAGDLVQVKSFVGEESSPNDVNWQFYSEDFGLALELLDNGGDPNGEGWRLAPMNFDSSSDDLSEVPFLQVPTGNSYERTFVARGEFYQNNYTHTFTRSSSVSWGIDFIIWEQEGLESLGIDSFVLHIAKDVSDRLWVLLYERNEETIIDAETILEAVLLSDLDDDIWFRLIAGVTNPDEPNDPGNMVVHDGITQQILSFTDSVDHIPHYQGELVRVERRENFSDPNHEVFYYHESRGLILNLRNGTTGAEGDGWHLAFFGAEFDDTSDDFREAPYLRATLNTVRRYFGQGAYTELDFEYEYTPRAHLTVNCMKWERSGVEEAGLNNFYMYLARDSLGLIWVFRYAIDGPLVFSATTIFDARPLSDFDDVMFFRLISGNFDPNYIGSAQNQFTVEESDPNVNHQIESFEGRLDYLPSLNQGLVREKIIPLQAEPRVGWRYFDESVGLVLQLDNTSENPSDPNYYDPNDTSMPPVDLTGWVLGWYGESPPDFDQESGDFTEVDFVRADKEDVRVHQGQGDFAGSRYRIIYAGEEIFEVDCLKINETEIVSPVRPGLELWLAKDTNDNPWLFRAASNGSILFEAEHIHEIILLEQFPDMYLRLISGEFDDDTTITTGVGANRQSERIIRQDASLADYEDFDNELVLVQWLQGDTPDNVSWTYFHESVGTVLQLWPDNSDPNSYDPNMIDTAGAGWHLTDPNRLEELEIAFKAGKTRQPASDTFKLRGQIPQARAEDFANTELFLSVGPWQMTIDTSSSEFEQRGNQELFKYKGSPDGTALVSLVIDLRRKKEFQVVASRVNLSGLDEPIKVALVAGDYFSSGEAAIMWNQKPPIEFFKGYADILRFKRYLFTFNDGPNAFNSFHLTVQGEIATEIVPVDLTGKEVTITWGSKEFTVPAGGNGLKRVRNLEKFTYRNSNDALRSVMFDMGKCTFRLVIRKTNLGKPPQDLTIRFEIEDGVFFEQTVTII